MWVFKSVHRGRARSMGRGRRELRKAGLLAVPPGMLAIRKESLRERAVNRRARRRAASALEGEVVETLEAFREGISEAEAARVVATGDVRLIINAVAPNDLEAELGAEISQALEGAADDGARIGLRFAPPELEGVPLSLVRESAAAFLSSQGANAALGLTQTTQAGIREILNAQLAGELTTVEAARRIGDLAGLTPRGVRAVENFRRATTARLIPVPAADTVAARAVVGRQVEAFRLRQLKQRGRTIAETEVQRAVTEGERAFWDRAIADGATTGEAVFRTWRTVLDTRVCPICFPLHGQIQRFNDPFDTSVGAIAGPPAHPRCRCFLEFVEDENELGEPRIDRGADAVRAQESRRFLDPEAVQEDVSAAFNRRERVVQRLSRVRPGSRAEGRLRRELEVATSTINSLRARLDTLRIA